jgi:hypothetical protein
MTFKLDAIRWGMYLHPQKYPLKSFSDKPKHYVWTANRLTLYIIELFEARRYRAQGHHRDACKGQERCRAIYKKLPEYARWRRG